MNSTTEDLILQVKISTATGQVLKSINHLEVPEAMAVLAKVIGGYAGLHPHGEQAGQELIETAFEQSKLEAERMRKRPKVQ